jgi:hypothetical protein
MVAVVALDRKHPTVRTTCPLSFRVSAGFKIKLHVPRASGREESRAVVVRPSLSSSELDKQANKRPGWMNRRWLHIVGFVK